MNEIAGGQASCWALRFGTRYERPRTIPRAALRLCVLLAVGLSLLGGAAPDPAAAGTAAAPKSLLQLDKLKRGITFDRQLHAIPPPPELRIQVCDVQLLKRLGFDYVKLVVNPVLFISGSGLNASNMPYIDEMVNTVVGEGMPVVVCLHPEPDFKKTYLGDAAGFQDLLGFYEAFAGYLAERWGPEELAFQLMTEPFGNYTSWNELQPQMWQSVRREMPKHALVLSGDAVGTIVALVNVKPVKDDNVLYGFSTYEPFLLNLQGAGWQGAWWPFLGDVPYPSSPEIVADAMDAILDSVPGEWHDAVKAEAAAYGDARWSKDKQTERFQAVVDWCKKHGVRAWCSEFGNLDPVMGGQHNGGINAADRYAYLRDLREVFEENGIGWTYWSFNETFTVLDPKTRSPFGYPNGVNIDPQMLKALGLPAAAE
jgi:endoglucanase